jgi:uncharacterized glyoxalase superfamily protein PhnB
MTVASKPTPAGWPRISSALYSRDAALAIDWLCRAFGFEVRIRVDGPDGRVMHSELTLGKDGVVMIADERHKKGGTVRQSPASTDGSINTQTLFVYIDDADAHCEQARAAGAKIESEPATVDYGEGHWVDRGYQCVDPDGHHWAFAHRVSG